MRSETPYVVCYKFDAVRSSHGPSSADAARPFGTRVASWSAPVLWRFRNTTARTVSRASSEFRIHAAKILLPPGGALHFAF
jgi:hypothetical protein